MTDRFGLRFVTVAGGVLVSIAMAAPAAAQIRIDKDQTGRVVAITGLPTSSGCVRGTGVGRVVDRVVEKGELQGFTFNEPPYDDSYINLPAAYDIRDRAAYARLQAAFSDLFRKDARLKISSVACGAAGKIVKLVSATLVDTPPAPRAAPVTPAPASAPAALAAPPAAPLPPAPAAAEPMDALLRSPDSPSKPATATKPEEPPPAAAPEPKSAAEPPPTASQPKPAVEPPPAAPRRPSRWQLTQPTKVQVELRIRSDDRAFGFSFNCSRGPKGNLEISNWFLPPGNWSISKSPTPASIDGRPQRWEVDGADEGLVFSDAAGSSSGLSTLSAAARGELARGQRFVVSGRMDRGGRPREAVFDISNSEEVFAVFDARCRAFGR